MLHNKINYTMLKAELRLAFGKDRSLGINNLSLRKLKRRGARGQNKKIVRSRMT